MSLKGPLRRLSKDVEWLENEGTARRIEIMMKIVEMKQDIADNLARDKEKAAEFARAGLLRTLNLPPPSWAKRPAPPAPAPRPVAVERPPPLEPTPPHPEERCAAARPEGSEPAPRPEPIKAPGLPGANRDAALPAALQYEGVRVEPLVVTPPAPPLKPVPPPEPELVQPFIYDPPPEMQIRP
jgi:hypothetical protein